MRGLELDESNSGSTQTVVLGESVTIRLPENAGTAFLWHVLDGHGSEFTVSTGAVDRDQAGASSTRIFVFTPTVAGTMVVRLARHRPWQPVDVADQHFSVNINVLAGYQ